MKKLGFLACFMLSCALLTSKELKEEKDLFPVCKVACDLRYSDVYGIQFRKVRNDFVFCKCLMHRGDKVIYVVLENNEIEGSTEVEEFRY